MSLNLSETQFPPTRVAGRFRVELDSTLILVLQAFNNWLLSGRNNELVTKDLDDSAKEDEGAT